MYPMEKRCTSVETMVTTRSMTAVTLSMRMPASNTARDPTLIHGTTTWYLKFGSYAWKTS